MTILEVRFGLQIMPGGRRRTQLMEAFDGLLRQLDGRVASFDTAAAQEAGDLMAARQKRGRPVELRDAMIAGIVLGRHATLATRNIAHFGDIPIPLINPWTA